jgi:hypothetical protein
VPPKPQAPPGGGPTFLGKDIPLFNPGNEIITWDGKSWNINNNRIFQARFEKYLNAPEETGDEDRAYRGILEAILERLAPERAGTKAVDEAWRLLPKASDYEIDANLCDGLADAVYNVWLAKREYQRLESANEALDRERRQHEWNAQVTSRSPSTDSPPANKAAQANWAAEQKIQRDLRLQPYLTRLAEIKALQTANKAKRELNEVQAKLEFQTLVVQYFFQRRFQHVVIGARFYRSLFGDGDTKLKLGKDGAAFFNKTTGMPPTVGVLDALAREAMRDAREGVKAYEFLLGKNELESATKRLAEAFVIGEYLPELRTLSRDKKREALGFAQKTNQLISAIEVKDYSLAEKIVKQLEVEAKDFDNSQPMAAIETARTVSAMHLAKAKNAAVSGDRATLEAELKAATEIWPRNPALAEVSGLIFSQADVQQQALVDLDRLLSQRNYRQVFDDKVRFIAATALYPDRQEALRKVLEDMQTIESGIIRADEIAKRGDFAGAWESVERVFQKFPDDAKLNQRRATLTTEAAEFVRTLKTAEQLEQKGQVGSGLAWYLKAQRMYPPSDFAREGVERMVERIIPKPSP